MWRLVCAFGLCAFAPLVVGYPSGAPDTPEILQSMRPGHRGEPMPQSTCPYRIASNRTGSSFTLTLSSPRGTSAFKGFLVEVRNSSGARIGSFAPSSKYKLIGGRKAVTHLSSARKAAVAFKWKMPANLMTTQAIVYYTVVEKYSTYWVANSQQLHL